jgi:predicted N-formylglutamate amidohydrolase
VQHTTLLAADEPQAFQVEQALGQSPFFFTCDHASARVPRQLDSLGLSAQDLQRHIAWDIGAAAVSRMLAAQLDAFLIMQSYSRLVIDCNRPPGSAQSIVTVSEATRIPGNEALSSFAALAREREVFRPYHDRLRAELDLRHSRGRPTILIAMHSFTPVFHGKQRAWQVGVLYNRDRGLAQALLRVLRQDRDLVVGDNEPYSVSDGTDYTIPVHGERRGLMHVGIELRQDLVADEAGQQQWAVRLAQALPTAVAEVQREDPAGI